MQSEFNAHGIDSDSAEALSPTGSPEKPSSDSKKETPTLRERLDDIPQVVKLFVEVIVLFGAGVGVMMLHSDLSFTDAFYFCVITATTIGYGDFTPAYKGGCCDEPTGHAGNWFGVAFCLMSITMLGRVLGAFSETMASYQEAMMLKMHLKKLELSTCAQRPSLRRAVSLRRAAPLCAASQRAPRTSRHARRSSPRRD